MTGAFRASPRCRSQLPSLRVAQDPNRIAIHQHFSMLNSFGSACNDAPGELVTTWLVRVRWEGAGEPPRFLLLLCPWERGGAHGGSSIVSTGVSLRSSLSPAGVRPPSVFNGGQAGAFRRARSHGPASATDQDRPTLGARFAGKKDTGDGLRPHEHEPSGPTGSSPGVFRHRPVLMRQCDNRLWQSTALCPTILAQSANRTCARLLHTLVPVQWCNKERRAIADLEALRPHGEVNFLP